MENTRGKITCTYIGDVFVNIQLQLKEHTCSFNCNCYQDQNWLIGTCTIRGISRIQLQKQNYISCPYFLMTFVFLFLFSWYGDWTFHLNFRIVFAYFLYFYYSLSSNCIAGTCLGDLSQCKRLEVWEFGQDEINWRSRGDLLKMQFQFLDSSLTFL